MPVKVQQEGHYELFETTKRHEILVLNDEYWYSIVEGQAGEIIVLTDSDHNKRDTLQKGAFYLVDFEDDPTFRDIPHLFLEVDEGYEEAILPNGLPTEDDKQRKIIRADEKISSEELEEYLRNPAPAGPGAERRGRPGGGSLSNVVHYLRGIELPADRHDLIGYAERKDAPRPVIDQLEEVPEGKFYTMADVTKAVGEGKEPLPLADYNELSASEIEDRLDQLDEGELAQLQEYEEDTLGRRTILRSIDEKLELRDDSLPIEGYEDMNGDKIISRLEQLTPDELKMVKEFEKDHRSRTTVLEAIDRQLGE